MYESGERLIASHTLVGVCGGVPDRCVRAASVLTLRVVECVCGVVSVGANGCGRIEGVGMVSVGARGTTGARLLVV